MEYTPDMERAIKMAETLNVKFSTAHVEGVNWLWSAATQYVERYDGTFSYMLKLRSDLKRYKRLGFANQVSGALNCLMVQYRNEQNAKEAAAHVIDFADVDEESDRYGSYMRDEHDYKTVGKSAVIAPEKGYYTIVFEEAEHITIRVTRVGENTRFAYLFGSDNETSYKPYAYLWNGKLSRIREAKANTRVMEAINVLVFAKDTTEFGKAYALASGNCYRCGRTLTDPDSIAASLGPICRGAM